MTSSYDDDWFDDDDDSDDGSPYRPGLLTILITLIVLVALVASLLFPLIRTRLRRSPPPTPNTLLEAYVIFE
ncbi:MAG: hypothetical protein R3264_12205 [Anaerolineae bacterium]|nr:hypothetical protein [Anaerolineae bacterium]